MSVWDDVVFDHGACDEAIAALESAARRVDEVAELRREAARRAVDDWVGPTRDRFDAELRGSLQEAADVAARLRREAGRLRDAAEEAIEEQRRRERRREEIRRERELAEACAVVTGGPTPC